MLYILAGGKCSVQEKGKNTNRTIRFSVQTFKKEVMRLAALAICKHHEHYFVAPPQCNNPLEHLHIESAMPTLGLVMQLSDEQNHLLQQEVARLLHKLGSKKIKTAN